MKSVIPIAAARAMEMGLGLSPIMRIFAVGTAGGGDGTWAVGTHQPPLHAFLAFHFTKRSDARPSLRGGSLVGGNPFQVSPLRAVRTDASHPAWAASRDTHAGSREPRLGRCPLETTGHEAEAG